jgi:hypothetical protein
MHDLGMGTLEPLVHLRSELRSDGYPDYEVARLVRAGRLAAVRRGAYVLGPAPADPLIRHLAQIRAAVAQLGPWAVVSHVSAAVLHGWQPWAVSLEQVRVTRDARSGGRSNSALHVYTAPLDAEEIELVGRIAVTSAARTLVDVARTVPFEQAVVLADQALAKGNVDAGSLRMALARAVGWQGVPAARRAIGFADGASGSVGESRSRLAIARAGLPAPQLQWTVRNHRGTHVATVDFGWREQLTVGEFDGLVKYGRLLAPGQSAADAVVAEKIREDALRAQNLQVVRWLWRDLDNFAPVAARILRCLDR